MYTKTGAARRASAVASRRRAMALGAAAAAAARKGETEQGEDVEKFRHSASFHRVIFRQLKDRLTRDRDRLDSAGGHPIFRPKLLQPLKS